MAVLNYHLAQTDQKIKFRDWGSFYLSAAVRHPVQGLGVVFMTCVREHPNTVALKH
jgi:hypothetical protein